MKLKHLAALLGAIVLFGAVSAWAQEEAIRTCALTKAFECTSAEGCREWPLKEMALPRFFRIDLTAGTLTSLDRDVLRAPTVITAVDRPEGLLVLHGADKRGWSLALGEQSGALTLSGTGEDAGFVVFGSCMQP